MAIASRLLIKRPSLVFCRLSHATSREEIRRRMIEVKATMDYIPHPIHNWDTFMRQKRIKGYVTFATGLACLTASIYLFNKLGMYQGMPYSPPYHLIGNEPFPGYKYDDDTIYPSDQLADQPQEMYD